MPKLDARPTLADHRDFLLKDYLAAPQELERTSGERHWRCEVRLDQRAEGSCVGNGFCHWYDAEPFPHTAGESYARKIYEKATEIDQFPGDWRSGQEGTDVRSGAKVMKMWGHISSYAFAKDAEESALWLLNHGPVVIGVPWFHSMDTPEGEYGYTPVDTRSGVRGWHCVAVLAVYWHGGKEDDWFYFRNSWGRDWGNDGGGRFTAKDFETLLNVPGAVVCTAVEKRR
ncbi:C1 family peptidase [Rubrobacter calidifluminis]|uniref:C1 family peptidase n=1 Tax=Rubrobacter calidifluminis TaxID=1392640 RepID=UPI002360A106|nr:C1 family peptidase [Rubrobacter calidifluminis]